MELVGDYLKKVRIEKNFSLDHISNNLNISKDYIKSIEQNDFEKTPGGVFTMGYIRSYANFLNLDSNEIVKIYKNQISFKNNEKIEISKPIEPFNYIFSNKVTSFFSVASLLIVFYFLFIYNTNFNPNYSITPDISENLQYEIEEIDIENYNFVKNENDLNNLEKINEDLILPKELTNNQIIDEKKHKKNISAIASLPRETDIQEIKKIITLKSLDTTWIQLRNKEDDIVLSKLFDKNEEYSYSFNDELSITTGNAGNILVIMNGEALGKLGKKGQVLESLVISSKLF